MANYYEQCDCGGYFDEAPCERCRAKQGMTTTNTAQGLLTDILEHPGDDDLRLIFADWLDDHEEEERAEFIRVQVELANHPLCLSAYPGEHLLYPYCAGCRTVHRLYPRMEALWYLPAGGSGFTEESSRGLALTIGGAIPDCQIPQLLFRRGFVAEVHAPLAVLQHHLPAIVRQHPIERVRATDKEPDNYAALTALWPEHWSWWSNNDNDPSSVQKQVWKLLDGFDPGYTSMEEECRNYPTAEAAHEALSVALLKLARRS